MSAGEPGWYQDPGGQPGLRWWDGVTWGSELRPPGPSASPGRAPDSWRPATSTESRATFDPPRFGTSPGSLYQPARPAPASPRRSPVLWLGLAGAAILLVVGMVLISSHHSSSEPTAQSNDLTTTTATPGVTVGPNDSAYTDTGSLCTIATGPTWKAGLPGISNSATWSVTLDASNTAKVQVLPSRLDSPQPAATLTQSDAASLDPTGQGPVPTPLYLVDRTGTDQLADGSAAGTIHLHTNPANPANPVNVGADLVGDALVASKGDTGAMVLLLCPAATASTCLPALLPYARTIALTGTS